MEHQLFKEERTGFEIEPRCEVVIENEKEKTSDHRGRDEILLKKVDL